MNETISGEEYLNELVAAGAIKSHAKYNVDENGVVGKTSHGRNTERLVLELNSGHKICIDTFCSGCLEDTGIIVSKDDKEGIV